MCRTVPHLESSREDKMALSRNDEWERLLNLMRRVRDEVEGWDEWRKGPEYIAASNEAKAARTNAESQPSPVPKVGNLSR